MISKPLGTETKISIQPNAGRHHFGGTTTLIAPERITGTSKRIQSLDISTDSVVATATIVVTDATRRIEIDWGDGTIDVLRQRPGIISPDPPPPGTNPLPRGTYEVEHAYEVPDGAYPSAFDQFVFVRTDDADGGIDIRQRRITITPRYRIVHYPMSVYLGESCDLAGSVLIKVVQSIDGEIVNRWNWSSSNFFGPSFRFRLEGSGASLEVETPRVGEVWETKQMVFDFLEEDSLSPDDRNRIVVFLAVGLAVYPPYTISENIEQVNDDGCEIHYSYGREVTLLKPRKHTNPGVFAPT